MISTNPGLDLRRNQDGLLTRVYPEPKTGVDEGPWGQAGRCNPFCFVGIYMKRIHFLSKQMWLFVT